MRIINCPNLSRDHIPHDYKVRSSEILVENEGPAPSPLANGDVKSGITEFSVLK